MTEKQYTGPRQEWEQDALRAVPNRLVADIVSDARRGISQSASLIPEKQRAAEAERPVSGGVIERGPPPGINYIDRMCDAADRADQIARARVELENRWIESHFEKGPRIERDYNPFAKPEMDE